MQLGIHLFGEVELSYPAIIEIVIILVAAFLSFKTTKVEIRRENHFTWGAIQEVAVLFIGIFITMQPALMILKANGANLGISEPFEMFWATGLLSSFLDNTPTYLVSEMHRTSWLSRLRMKTVCVCRPSSDICSGRSVFWFRSLHLICCYSFYRG